MRLKRTYLVTCLVLMLSIVNVAQAEKRITPYYSYTISIAASLSINDGIAKATGKVIPKENRHTSITVHLTGSSRGE